MYGTRGYPGPVPSQLFKLDQLHINEVGVIHERALWRGQEVEVHCVIQSEHQKKAMSSESVYFCQYSSFEAYRMK